MSSEEQYKYIEDKIIEAANASDHAFNESSWKKMEALLDQKKDKRRPFSWIFSSLILGVLILGGGIIYRAVNKNERSGKTGNQVSIKNTDKQIQPSSNGTGDVATLQQTALPGTKTNNITATADNYNRDNKNIYKSKVKYALQVTVPELENGTDKTENKTGSIIDIADTKKITDQKEANITELEKVNKPDMDLGKTVTVTKTENKKDKKQKSNAGFYLLAAAGMEANATKLLTFTNSSITPVYGVGLGYQFNRRLSVQTGFYAGAKKYIAGPNDYNTKAGSYLATVKIVNVDANCMVYEVPVIVQYNLRSKAKVNYYAAAGLSSYIMKKERYDYTFERNNIQYSYPYNYTKNSHLFASVQLSLGVEKQIGHQLFIQAAPTVTLPLRGVGEGNVKLFTTGLQLGLKYFLFKH